MPAFPRMLLLLTLVAAGGAAAQEQYRFADYFEALPRFWGEIYPDGGETLYCGTRFGQRHPRSINVEHVFPMGWAMKAVGCRSRKQCRETSPRFNRIEADLHNLYPAQGRINEARGSMAYGTIAGEPRRFGACDFEIDERQRRVEPRPASRGNIARAMFHMHQSYGLPLYPRQARLLLRWHREDPADDAERARNGRIERIQGTRNRFIDEPAAAEQLGF